jgi:hypothetical protein
MPVTDAEQVESMALDQGRVASWKAGASRRQLADAQIPNYAHIEYGRLPQPEPSR